jgi:hypothetical protein
MHLDRSLLGQTVLLGGIAVAVVLTLFLWQGHYGFNIGDEGYLWYGVQRTMVGEIPIRDFQSYDPGRYYWSAILMLAWGNNGITALRGSVAVFQAIALFFALFLLPRRNLRIDFALTLVAVVTFALWMYPRHKLFDISLSISLIFVLTLLVRRPCLWRFFFAGVAVGFAAVFGRNHGVYGLCGSLGVTAYLACRRDPTVMKGFWTWLIGILVGYLPVLAMILFVPGFAAEFWSGIRFLFEVKATNLPLPVPWPWQASLVPFSLSSIQAILVGLAFVSILLFAVCSILWMLWRGWRRGLVEPQLPACAMLAFPYAQFAYSRADVGHLAQGIFPFLLGAFVFAGSRGTSTKWTIACFLLIASLVVMLPLQPGWDCRVAGRCVDREISGSKLKIDRATAFDLDILKKMIDRYAPQERVFVATPILPGAYAAFGRKSPMWEIYALFPRSDLAQKREIARIKKADPGFLIVLDYPLDGREELRFRNTHPLIDRFFKDHFERLPDSAAGSAYQLYKAKNATN